MKYKITQVEDYGESSILEITDGKETLYFLSGDKEGYFSCIDKITRSEARKLKRNPVKKEYYYNVLDGKKHKL